MVSSVKTPRRPFLCCVGVHLECVSGLGVMEDALICLRCGYERYPESFFGFYIIESDLDQLSSHDRVEVWYPRVDAARKLKSGIDYHG